MTETVIIEFVSDSTGLQPAEDKLAAIGKIDAKTAQVFKQTNTELKNRVSVLTAVGQQAQKVNTETGKMKGTISDLDKVTKSFTQNFMQGFEEGVIQSLKEAGVSSEQFANALKKGSGDAQKSTKSLRAELSGMRQELVRMKLAGKENTDEFKKMEQAAGKLDDAIRDVSAAVKNVGSDTATLEGAVGIFQGISGAASVATATVALFGEENEDLQEVLLRVNALMAITQGLQSAATIFQKESSAAKLADIIVTRSQAAAQGLYNFVVGTSIGLTKAFKIALASTGVGLLVIGLIELISALQSTETELEDVNFELKLMKGRTEGARKAIEDLADIEIARARQASKLESDLIRIRGRSTVEQVKAIQEENKRIAERRDGLDQTSEAYNVLNNAIEENNAEIKKLNKEALIQSIELQTQLTEEQKKAAEEKEKLDRENAEKARKLRISALNDELAILELKALNAEKGGQIEITIQKKILAIKAKLDLEQEGLTANQKLLIAKKSLNDQLQLQKEFNKKSSQEAIDGLISRNNAELQQLNLSSEERLRLQIENLISQAQIEADQAEGNASKIKEINAKRDADIKAARLKSIQETATDEIELEAAKSGAMIRALKARLADEDTGLTERLGIIDEITNHELEAIGIRLEALNNSFSQGLISLREYNLEYNKLVDQQSQIVENAEAQKQAAIKKTKDLENDQNKRRLQNIIDSAQVVVTVLGDLYKLQADKEAQRINDQKRRVEELRASGAISEKEAVKRLKNIEQQERAIAIRNAQRDKQLALFQAIINTAAGIAKAIPDPFRVALAAALGAAQIAIIAARPIPKFKKGKKDQYEGLGEVGEAGTELIEKDGRMYVADKPTVIWLGKKDKVYNPSETKQMMKQQPTVNKSLMQVTNNHNGKELDYDKLAKKIGGEVAKNVPQPILNITEKGISEAAKRGNSIEIYLDKRRGWGG